MKEGDPKNTHLSPLEQASVVVLIKRVKDEMEEIKRLEEQRKILTTQIELLKGQKRLAEGGQISNN